MRKEWVLKWFFFLSGSGWLSALTAVCMNQIEWGVLK